MSFVIGVDLGTGSLKAILVDQTGEIIVSAVREYPLLTSQPGYSEQNPSDWTTALDETLKEIITKEPTAASETIGISFSGQMHSLVLLDGHGKVLRDAILWNDVRTTKECQRISETLSADLLAITKNKALEGFTLPKLLWVQENEPEVWQQISHCILPKDYLGYYLTGTIQMDYSDASGTLLLDMNTNEWSRQILETFSISEKIMPKLVCSTTKIGEMKLELAQKYGFTTPVKIFAGGADNACAAIAAGIDNEKVGMVSIGTSGVFLANDQSTGDDYGGKLHYFNHGMPEQHYAMGVTLAAGQSLTWLRDTFFQEEAFSDLVKGSESIPVGANGLLFSPYIMGERTPHTDSLIRGSFIGLSSNHQKAHIVRAVIEGITFSIKESQEIMEEAFGSSFETIVSVGGGTKSQLWLQIQADIFNATIKVLKTDEGPAFGAAMIAAVGSEWFSDLEECINWFVTYRETFVPNSDKVIKYQELYQLYQEIYPQTQQLNKKLSQFR